MSGDRIPTGVRSVMVGYLAHLNGGFFNAIDPEPTFASAPS
jgi:hypothetical protein